MKFIQLKIPINIKRSKLSQNTEQGEFREVRCFQ